MHSFILLLKWYRYTTILDVIERQLFFTYYVSNLNGRQDYATDAPQEVSILQFFLPLAVPWFNALPRERIVCIILFNLTDPLIYGHHDKHKKLISTCQ